MTKSKVQLWRDNYQRIKRIEESKGRQRTKLDASLTRYKQAPPVHTSHGLFYTMMSELMKSIFNRLI